MCLELPFEFRVEVASGTNVCREMIAARSTRTCGLVHFGVTFSLIGFGQ